MKFPVEWIKEHVEVKLSDAEIASLLTSIGFAVEAVEEVEGEKVFEIDVTTNRPDCMNIAGLAREIAAAARGRLSVRKGKYPEAAPPSRSLCKVEILDPSLCPRYSGRVIRNVKVSPSPPRLAKRIIQAGLRPVNNIVDASNYVLLELGHPIHIFDLAKLKGNRIIVRKARKGERIVTIDGIERLLTEEMLVIADESDPVAVAGIMGGLHSEVSNSTRDIFIESACFDPRSVRLTSKKLGLSTDASYRFERGADFNATLKAIERVTSLILDGSKGEVTSGFIDVIKRKPPKKEIAVRVDQAAKILGVRIKEETAVRILKSLEMKVTKKGKGMLRVVPPSFRADIEREIDLIEEIGRFVRYDTLPCSIPYSTDQKIKNKPDPREEWLKTMIAPSGYSEAINYSMIADAEDEIFCFHQGTKPLKIDNPLSEKVVTLRRSLLHGLFRNTCSNLSRGLRDIRLFEIGKVYHVSPGNKLEEKKHIALMATGASGEEHWEKEKKETGLWDIKGAAEAILERFHCPFSLREPVEGSPEAGFFERTLCFELISEDGRKIAIGGKISPALAQEQKIFQPVWAVEVSLDDLPDPSRRVPRFRSLSPLPLIKRDLSILVKDDLKYSRIEDLFKERWTDSSVEIGLKNRYSGTPVPEGKVSLTLSITVHQKDKTLTNEEINEITGKILGILSAGAGAELRKE